MAEKVEFPKFVYFADGRAVCVPDLAALTALGPGWAESRLGPFGEPEALSPEPVPAAPRLVRGKGGRK